MAGDVEFELSIEVLQTSEIKILHGCPVKSRTESVGWDELVTLLGSQISEVPVEWVFSRTG
jgi:hypothetical protein